MTATMHFESEAKQSFTHKKRYLLKRVCEKTYRKKKFLYSNTINDAYYKFFLNSFCADWLLLSAWHSVAPFSIHDAPAIDI
ncbi:MAG: hypothetical protein DYG84_08355 [Candidatus Brocadia sp. AMX3]|nr:hypothetical protein [Candidatus Brocadia sp. AMX3]